LVLVLLVKEYYGFEPYTKTYNGLNKLGDWIKERNERFNFKINNLPFEDALLENESFDFAFTSPPYYDTEKYGNEKTNSYNRYNSFSDWCDFFYLPMIEKTMKALKKDCSFVLNIGSRIYPLNEVLKSNFSNKYSIEKEKDMLQGNKSGLKNNQNEGETFYSNSPLHAQHCVYLNHLPEFRKMANTTTILKSISNK
jgi:DNA modification methylase